MIVEGVAVGDTTVADDVDVVVAGLGSIGVRSSKGLSHLKSLINEDTRCLLVLVAYTSSPSNTFGALMNLFFTIWSLKKMMKKH